MGVRSITYLHTTGEKVLNLKEEVNEERGCLHAPSAAIGVERRSIVVWDGGLHTTTSIAVGKGVAVQSGGGAIVEKDCVSDNSDNTGSLS